MAWLLTIGIAFTVTGILGLLLCAAVVFRAKRVELPEAEMTKILQRVLVWNLSALGLASFGLMIVIVALFLQ